MPVSEQNYTY